MWIVSVRPFTSLSLTVAVPKTTFLFHHPPRFFSFFFLISVKKEQESRNIRNKSEKKKKFLPSFATVPVELGLIFFIFFFPWEQNC